MAFDDALPEREAPASSPPVFGPIEHLLAELRRLDLLLLHALPKLRPAAGEPIPALRIASDDDPELALAAHTAATRAALHDAIAAGVRLPLVELCRNLQLDDAAVGALVLAIAPHVARHYEDVFAWIQGDAALRAPQLELALSLFAASTADRLRLRQRLVAGPLFTSGFVSLAEPPGGCIGEPARLIVASPRLLRFLCDHPGAEPDVEAVRARAPLPPVTAALVRELAALRSLVDTAARTAAIHEDELATAESRRTAIHTEDELAVDDGRRAALRDLAHAGAPIAVVQTEDGLAALAAAAQLAEDAALPALLIDLSRPHAARAPIDATLKAVFDEAHLQGALLAITGYDDLPSAVRDAAFAATAAHLERFDHPFLAITAAPLDLRHELRHRAVVTLAVALPDTDERAALWRAELGDRTTCADDVAEIGRGFRLGAGQIRDAARMVATLDAIAGPRPDHLRTASRAQSRHQLGDLAQRVAPWGRWQDLVIPRSSVERLHEVITSLHHREAIFVDWGLRDRVAVWRRVTALFAGPPGTGKTLSASLVAQALGLDLFRIDLSGVVSKYIGETEKNLDRVFRAAYRCNAILFFDEADSLFGKRTEVKDAHDRYANVETSYLLQKLESFEGLAILATNYKKNIDPAFLRRIDVVVDFPMPAKDERRRLWRSLVPDAMPLAPDVDLDFLADRFELSGGSILNAIRAAATRAAADRQPVAMAPLLRGVRDELHKHGKLISAHDLGPFAKLIDGDAPRST